jgi:hypothetical protein
LRVFNAAGCGLHQAEILCLAHDVDRDIAVLDRCDSDAA